MKTALERGSLVVPHGYFKPTSVWCFEPVGESGRTLCLAQRSVAFRRKVGEHEKECLFLFCVHALRQKERYADTIFTLLRHRCSQGFGDRLRAVNGSPSCSRTV